MEVRIQIQNVSLVGELNYPEKTNGLVIFAHGSGSFRNSPRNLFVSSELNRGGVASLVLDLLTEEEGKNLKKRLDIDLMTERLIGVTKWVMEEETNKGLPLGYFGSSMGSAAALSASAYWGTKIAAVVSQGGRPDLAMEELDLIESPVMFIVGGEDREVIDLNRKAFVKMGCTKKMEIVPGATHLFEEPGALQRVAELSLFWFTKHFLNSHDSGLSSESMEKGVATIG